MKRTDDRLVCSATDLSNFLGCQHRTALDMAAALGKRKRPHVDDPLLEVLFARGLEHEARYVDSLRQSGLDVVDLSGHKTDREAALAATADAMKRGVDVVVQAALAADGWFGYADVLRKVARPSALGAWSYEVTDTKLALETRAGTILQLSLYSSMLADVQGVAPEWFHVVTPAPDSPRHSYRVDDFAAYFRLIRERLRLAVESGNEALAAAHYPEPVDACDVCAWAQVCRDRRRADDHLSLVAGISRFQRDELRSHDVTTLTALAEFEIPDTFKPKRGARDTYLRVREQARLQHLSRGKTPPLYELRPDEADLGLHRLPQPSPGDVFLDLEGDPFADEGGREYLFGLVTVTADGALEYQGHWALDAATERAVFEHVIDWLAERCVQYPDLHIYHYAPYEPGAFKRLMGRYATREAEVDQLLRQQRFVDLYGVVRQAIVAGIERYSIKTLEPFYAFTRSVPLQDANRALRTMEHALETQCAASVAGDVRDVVEGYNRDDCESTFHLRQWLEQVRLDAIQGGRVIDRPAAVGDGEPSDNLSERTRRIEALRAQLLNGIPEDATVRSAGQHARWLLAYLLDWHRREDKAGWWEYYRLRELAEDELLDEPQAVSGLAYTGVRMPVISQKTGRPTTSVIDRYTYPVQEMELRLGDQLKLQDGKAWGKVVAVDRVACTLDVAKGPSKADQHPSAVFAHDAVSTTVLEDALFQLGTQAAEGEGIDALPGAARALLLREVPRLVGDTFTMRTNEEPVDFAVRVAPALDDTCLAIQGPPGSGKTYSGARMIVRLVQQGKKVGVVATSHKVIRNLLDGVVEAARQQEVPLVVGHRQTEPDDEPGSVRSFSDYGEIEAALAKGEVQVLGGTSWLWARPEFAGAVDVLCVDEAGQLSLANALAVSRAARSLVLLGDPQQLEQPQKGTHPDGADASALEHILGGHKTIPPEQGLFLPVTRRLCPDICTFTSELFYESRLSSHKGLERQVVQGCGNLDGAGLRFVPVVHEGNRNVSVEEVDVVSALVARFVDGSWVDQAGATAPLRPEDLLVVAPYNAQVNRLQERLAAQGVRVGTVDKFQGQEAPVVIYSMTTSRPEDAPRGLEFLYSLNRLNVATSRARCVAVLVASPRLFEPECRTPRQMLLANALCRYRELATVLTP